MIKVNIKDLESKKVLEFDLYNERGRMICPGGTDLTPGKILQLTHIKLFRKVNDSVVEINVEEPISEPDIIVVTENVEVQKPPLGFDSKIDEDVRHEILISTREFLNDIQSGKTPDRAICEVVSDTLVKEVTDKIEEVDYLGQLRMFDEYTYSHNVNVSALSVALGMKIGIKKDKIKDLALSTLLHDIGKMRIPKEILNKPGKLTDKEFEIIKLHTILGFKIITEELKLPFEIARVALEHQERFSGMGYPKRIKGDEIGQFSQICAIADVYDALCSSRVYKPAKTSQEAIKIMLGEGSKSFNPGLLYKFIHLCNYSDKQKI